MRYIGIDYGLRYVGLALGDDETRIATPFTTVDQTQENLFGFLKPIIKEEGIEVIVVGMPYTLGESREQEERTRYFINALHKATELPIYEWNEQFTSQESQRRMREGSDADEHSISAMVILQAYLDHIP